MKSPCKKICKIGDDGRCIGCNRTLEEIRDFGIKALEMNNIQSIVTSNSFCSLVERNVTEKSMTYIESITAVCDERGIDYENVSKLLTPTMKKILQAEAMRLNLIRSKKPKLRI
jgi:predicted Fe-S protein YdhL (DUF1289 family)